MIIVSIEIALHTQVIWPGDEAIFTEGSQESTLQPATLVARSQHFKSVHPKPRTPPIQVMDSLVDSTPTSHRPPKINNCRRAWGQGYLQSSVSTTRLNLIVHYCSEVQVVELFNATPSSH